MKKILIISDIHLTNDFDEEKYNYLRTLVDRYDQIVINGDFWSYYTCTFDDFVNSEWNQLFPILKEKTIYIHGNHDREEWCDDRVNLFSYLQTDEYVIDEYGLKVFVEHGHMCSFDSITNERFIKLNRKLKVDIRNNKVQKAIIDKLGVKFYNRLGKSQDKKFLKKAATKKDNEILVVGHNHNPKYLEEQKYMNSGYILFNQAYFVQLDEDGIKLMHETY